MTNDQKEKNSEKKLSDSSDTSLEKCREELAKSALKAEMLDHIPTPVMGVDTDFNITYLNFAGKSVLGNLRESFLGRKCYSFFNTGHCNTSECRVAKAMRQDGVFTGDTVASLPSGDLPIRYTGTPLKDDAGNIVGGLEFILDIRKEMEITNEVGQLVAAAVNGKLDDRANVEKFDGNYKQILQGVNDVLDAVIGPLKVAADHVNRISRGDIPEVITDEYKGDFNELKINLNRCITSLNGLIDQMNRMSEEHNKGDIDIVIDADKFEGAYKNMAQGINDMVNGHIEVKKKAMACVKQFGEGNFEAPLEKFPGKKAFINETIEQVRTNLKELIKETGMLVEAAVKGKLDTRGDTSRFGGDYARIIGGINDTLDAVVGPLKVAAEYIDRTSKGDIPEPIVDEYHGDFNDIKNSLNEQIHAFNLITEMAEQMAEGDLTVNIRPRSAKDNLMKSLAKMVGNLNNVLSQVNQSVEQIAIGSHEVSDSSQSLSQGATEQASSMEEISSSMEETASQTRQNAENASQANQLASQAREGAEKGNEQMGEMVQAMGEINESSHSISKIIRVIDEIAFQTNLLALNAAVEAARAGSHGKGFAVVAEEVRNLAARSAKAAKETSEMIEGSVKKVEVGMTIAKRTAEALSEIVADVGKVTDLVGEIAAASNEQALGIAQINQALTQIDQVTQQNTANAEESAAASEELSSQGVHLQQMVARFKLAKANVAGELPGGIEITPEMLQMLQKMLAQQKGQETGGGAGRTGNRPKSLGLSAPSRSYPSEKPEELISLDDDEMGRY